MYAIIYLLYKIFYVQVLYRMWYFVFKKYISDEPELLEKFLLALLAEVVVCGIIFSEMLRTQTTIGLELLDFARDMPFVAATYIIAITFMVLCLATDDDCMQSLLKFLALIFVAIANIVGSFMLFQM